MFVVFNWGSQRKSHCWVAFKPNHEGDMGHVSVRRAFQDKGTANAKAFRWRVVDEAHVAEERRNRGARGGGVEVQLHVVCGDSERRVLETRVEPCSELGSLWVLSRGMR